MHNAESAGTTVLPCTKKRPGFVLAKHSKNCYEVMLDILLHHTHLYMKHNTPAMEIIQIRTVAL